MTTLREMAEVVLSTDVDPPPEIYVLASAACECLTDDIVDQVARALWPRAAAVATQGGAFRHLRTAVRSALIWPAADAGNAERVSAAMVGIVSACIRSGDKEGLARMLRVGGALGALHDMQAELQWWGQDGAASATSTERTAGAFRRQAG
jgi:hypothetical protein